MPRLPVASRPACAASLPDLPPRPKKTEREEQPDGALFATTSRVDWTTLLRRTFGIDVLRCARCDGPVRVRAVVTDADAIASRLAVLGRPRAPPLAVA